MANKIFIALLLPFLFSCYHKNPAEVKTPDHLLSKDEMVDVIADIQLVEGAITYRRSYRIELEKFRESAYQQVFTTHNITAKILNENINYYNNQPEDMELIYEKVLAKLSKIQGEVDKEINAKKEEEKE